MIPRFHLSHESAPLDASLIAGFRKDCVAIDIETMSADTFAQENGLERIDLMKVDTEGAESLVLEGSRRILTDHRPIVFCEVLAGHGGKISEAMNPFGYRYFWIRDNQLVENPRLEGDETYDYKNYIFIPDESRAEIQDRIKGVQITLHQG